MIPAIEAEFRKLLTVRSTSVLSGIAIALVIFFAFYIEGWKLTGAELQNPNLFTRDVLDAISSVITFGALAGILLMTHEYRYNTIMYTLTANNSRSNVLFAKILAISVYAVVLTVIIGVLSPLMSYLGIIAHGHTLAPQTIDWGDLAWRALVFGWGYVMAGLLLAALIRNQVGAIAALFLIPGAVEQLLALLLKDNARYMPFTSLGQVVSSGHTTVTAALSPGTAAVVFLCYLVFFWIVAWILFLRRDAN